MTIVYASSQNFSDETAHNLVLLDFTSTWCEPCKMIDSVLEEIASEMNDTIKIIKIDLDENQDIANSFDIIGTPTLILLREGETLGKLIGYQTKKVIIDLIRKHT